MSAHGPSRERVEDDLGARGGDPNDLVDHGARRALRSLGTEIDVVRAVELARVESLLHRTIWTAVVAGFGIATTTWGAVLTVMLTRG